MVIKDEWGERLIELADNIDQLTNDLFGFGGARANVSRQVSEAEMVYISKVKHLIGYIHSLTYGPPRS